MPPLAQPAASSTWHRRLHLGPTSAFYLLASIIVSFLAASSAPTLYATYQAKWGFSAMTVTVIFGVYAVTFLAALLTKCQRRRWSHPVPR